MAEKHENVGRCSVVTSEGTITLPAVTQLMLAIDAGTDTTDLCR